MRILIPALILMTLIAVSFFVVNNRLSQKIVLSGAPPYGISEAEFPTSDRFSWLSNWERPDEPTTVGVQVGHYKNNELPEELKKHIGSTGSSGGGYTEAEVNKMVAEAVAKILERQSVKVDILPATIPPSYWADAFVSIHADGNLSSAVRGYKVASAWRDYTRNADELVTFIEDSYKKATNLPFDDNISRNMRGYYAFAWWRYEHAIHPMTPAVIIETGFLSNATDRKLLTDNPEIPAAGIAEGIVNYLVSKNLITQ